VGNALTFHKTTGKPFSITYATETAINDLEANDRYVFEVFVLFFSIMMYLDFKNMLLQLFL